MRSGLAGRIAWAAGGAGVVAAAGLWLYLGLLAPGPARPLRARVRVESGESLRAIGRKLETAGLVRNAVLFAWLGRWRGVDRRVRSGEYELPGGQTPLELLDTLAFGRRRLFLVTIPEGLTVEEVAARLEGTELGDAAAFLALARDPAFARSLSLPGEPSDLEGYLFPDTYDFRSEAPPGEILAQMARRFSEVFRPALERQALEAGLTAHQAVTLASLIEKEAATEAERPVISAVFHNRLRRGMPLQSDPTAVYGVGRPSGPIRREDLARPTSHNTYLLPGLPPGPIANPGRASLAAAVQPAAGVTALYFVARNDRTHEFSSTLDDHRRAVSRYQRNGR